MPNVKTIGHVAYLLLTWRTSLWNCLAAISIKDSKNKPYQRFVNDGHMFMVYIEPMHNIKLTETKCGKR